MPLDDLVRSVRRRFLPPVDGHEVLVINGHPDPRPERFCGALCNAYAQGARQAQRNVCQLEVGQLPLAAQRDGSAARSQELETALHLIREAAHLTVVFPLWLDKAPVPLQQLFAMCGDAGDAGRHDAPKTVRTVITMAMPAFTHRCRNGMHDDRIGCGANHLPRSMQLKPIYVGSVDTISSEQRQLWLNRLHALGMAGT
jgi:putative NADPH-quinone reductase